MTDNKTTSMPTTLKIGGCDYALKRPRKSFVCGTVVCDGACSTNNHWIKVSCEGDIQSQYITLLHEIVHALLSAYGAQINDDELEEVIASSISKGLFQVIRDNSDVFMQIINGGKL